MWELGARFGVGPHLLYCTAGGRLGSANCNREHAPSVTTRLRLSSTLFSSRRKAIPRGRAAQAKLANHCIACNNGVSVAHTWPRVSKRPLAAPLARALVGTSVLRRGTGHGDGSGHAALVLLNCEMDFCGVECTLCALHRERPTRAAPQRATAVLQWRHALPGRRVARQDSPPIPFPSLTVTPRDEPVDCMY